MKKMLSIFGLIIFVVLTTGTFALYAVLVALSTSPVAEAVKTLIS